MATRRLLPVIICLQLLIISCSENRNAVQVLNYTIATEVIYYNSPKTHGLVIYGNKMGQQLFPEQIFIKKVGAGNKEVKYEPVDQASLENSGYDFTYAWSPQGDFLLLPRGRFEGFTVFDTKQLPLAATKQIGKRSITIKDNLGTNMWHDFIGWKNDNTIVFKAGLSGDYYKFEWNVESGNLVSLDLKNEEYKAQNMVGS